MREIDRSPSAGQLQPESGLGGGLGYMYCRSTELRQTRVCASLLGLIEESDWPGLGTASALELATCTLPPEVHVVFFSHSYSILSAPPREWYDFQYRRHRNSAEKTTLDFWLAMAMDGG